METMSNKLKKVAAGVLAAAMVSSVAFTSVAFAADPVGTWSDTGGTTEGTTDLYIKINDLTEREQTAANVSFTVPAKINYVAEADGDVFGPTNAYIENTSAYRAFTSNYTAKAVNDWNIVNAAPDVKDDVRNAITVNLGPSADKHNISEGGSETVDNQASGTQKAIKSGSTGSKVALTNAAWDMKAHGTGTDYTEDQVMLVTDGKIKNVDNNINADQKFAEINWYVTPGTRA